MQGDLPTPGTRPVFLEGWLLVLVLMAASYWCTRACVIPKVTSQVSPIQPKAETLACFHSIGNVLDGYDILVSLCSPTLPKRPKIACRCPTQTSSCLW